MTGMNRDTGAAITDDDAQLAQDLADLFSTPVGSRVMRRDYGSVIPDLVDAPQNAVTALLLAAATAGAIRRWIRRISVKRCVPAFGADGRATLHLNYLRTDRPGGQLYSLAQPL